MDTFSHIRILAVRRNKDSQDRQQPDLLKFAQRQSTLIGTSVGPETITLTTRHKQDIISSHFLDYAISYLPVAEVKLYFTKSSHNFSLRELTPQLALLVLRFHQDKFWRGFHFLPGFGKSASLQLFVASSKARRI